MRTDQRRRDRSRAVRAHLNPLQRTSLFLVTALQTAFRTRNGSICRGAMGIAGSALAYRPGPRRREPLPPAHRSTMLSPGVDGSSALGGRFLGGDPRLYAPLPPGIPIAPLQYMADLMPQDGCRFKCLWESDLGGTRGVAGGTTRSDELP